MRETRGRLLWADAAKGAALVAVVLVHVEGKHFAETGWPVPERVLQGLEALTLAMLPIRMPLFFLISGFFAASAISRSWRTVIFKKSVHFYYLYLLWLAVQTALLQLAPGFDTEIADGVPSFLAQAAYTLSNLWYLYALAVYFPLAKLGARSPRVALAVAVALSMLAVSGIFPERGNLAAIPQNLIWFLVGCYHGPLVRQLAERAGLRVLLVAGVAFAVPSAAMAVLGGRDPILYTVASAAGACLGVVAVALAVRWVPVIGRLFAYVGQRTLAVYVMQMPLIALWHIAVKPTGLGTLMSNPVIAVIYPFLLTALVTAVTLLLYRVLKPIAPALFDRPGFLRLEHDTARPTTARSSGQTVTANE